jgi:anti-anti-sigma regulatory factor
MATASAVVPSWTERNRADMRMLWEVYGPNFDEVHDALDETLGEHPELAALTHSVSAESRRARRAQNYANTRAALVDDDWEPYLSSLLVQGRMIAEQGTSFGTWHAMTSALRSQLGPLIMRELRDDDQRLAASRGLTHFIDTSMTAIGEQYLAMKERTIVAQQESIRELSMPVLELREGLLLVPIIGLIDSDRARRLTESLLNEIRARRASVVVMDVTGVPAVDSSVANHLMLTVNAARLMGATTLVTGVSPDMAETLVKLGLDYSSVQAMGDLRAGIEAADRLLVRANEMQALPAELRSPGS